MQLLTEEGYVDLSSSLWWSKVAKQRQSASKRDVLYWLISTATLEDQGDGGNVEYDPIMAAYTEITNSQRGKGLRLNENEMVDLDGNGLEQAAQWSRDMGQLFAYDPQLLVAKLVNAGESSIGYDKVALFSASHPLNPVHSNGLTFANLFTGSASGTYPGALPIDESVTAEQALINLGKLYTYMSTVAHPNGVIPRQLEPVDLLVPPALMPRATLLTDAKFIAMSAGALAAQGGTTDVEGLIKMLGFAKPTKCTELAAAFGGSDTSYYATFAPFGKRKSQLGSIVYIERTPYSILYHGPMDQAELNRKDVFEWKAKGRNAVAPGHPYEIAKMKAS